VTGLLKANGIVAGVTARDLETGRDFEIKGRVVVNATGVFVDGVRRMDDPTVAAMIAPSQGVHLVLDKSFLPGESAIMVPHTADGRVMFAVPWHDRVVIGTTDTPVAEVSLEPRALPEEIEFLLSHAARYLTRDPKPADVLSIFAGLRPLVKAGDTADTASLSRDHTLMISGSGLVTITGGKWTTYRKMGEDTVTAAARLAGLEERPSITSQLRIHGWLNNPAAAGPWAVYGADAVGLDKLVAENSAWGEPLHPSLPYCACEVVWAVRHEWARSVEDVLARRTRALLLDARASIAAAPMVAALMAAELGRDATWQQGQVAAYTELARGYLLT
jgi:glycerol-3-phosphate dehydrogenase